MTCRQLVYRSIFVFSLVLAMPLLALESKSTDNQQLKDVVVPDTQTHKDKVTTDSQRDTLIKVTKDPIHGDILTDSKGMTLYVFTSDKANESTCFDECAVLWPPLTVKGRSS